jgi:outer membrane protein assembly factor BamE (lipoprotein component of BamABCDE complex)
MLLLVMALVSGGCQPTVNCHGNIVFDDAIAGFVVGQTKVNEVLDKCGTPSIYRDPLTWIYIKYKSEEIAFKRANAKDKLVVRMKFDQNGVLRSLDTIKADKFQDVQEDEEITEPSVKKTLTKDK